MITALDRALSALNTLIEDATDAALDPIDHDCGGTVERYLRRVTAERDSANIKAVMLNDISTGLISRLAERKPNGRLEWGDYAPRPSDRKFDLLGEIDTAIQKMTIEHDDAVAKAKASDAISASLLDQLHDLKTRMDIEQKTSQKPIDNTTGEILLTSWQTTLLTVITNSAISEIVEKEFSKLNRCIREQNTTNSDQNRELRELRGDPVIFEISAWQEDMLSRIGNDVVRDEVRHEFKASAFSRSNLSAALSLKVDRIEDLEEDLAEAIGNYHEQSVEIHRLNNEIDELKAHPCLNGPEGSIERLLDSKRATYSIDLQDAFDAAEKSMFEKAYSDLTRAVMGLVIQSPVDTDPELANAAASLDSVGPAATPKKDGLYNFSLKHPATPPEIVRAMKAFSKGNL